MYDNLQCQSTNFLSFCAVIARIKHHFHLFWRHELLNGSFTVAHVFEISFLYERSFSFLFLYKIKFANPLTIDLL